MTLSPPAKRSPEADLIAPVIPWLREKGWDVQTEKAVNLPGVARPRTPDIVACMGDNLAVLEGKVSLTAQAIAQAGAWRPFAHFVTLIVPHPGHRPTAQHKLLVKTVRMHGLGLLYVTKQAESPGHPKVRREIKAPRNPNPDTHPISAALSIGLTQPPQLAGSSSPTGQATARAWDRWAVVRNVVAENPGCTLKEIKAALSLKHSEHVELVRLAERQEIPGVIARTERGLLVLHLAEGQT